MNDCDMDRIMDLLKAVYDALVPTIDDYYTCRLTPPTAKAIFRVVNELSEEENDG